jgi:hypothetical protein
MIPVKNVLVIRGGEMKESSGRSEFKYAIFATLLRTFVNATMYHHPAQ